MAACRGCPPVDDSHLLCAGFLQCGSLVEVCNVDCVLSLGECLVLVRSGYACCAVGVGRRSGAALVDVRLGVVPFPPRSSSPTVAGCRLGGFPTGRDLWGGECVVGGVLTRINIGADV